MKQLRLTIASVAAALVLPALTGCVPMMPSLKKPAPPVQAIAPTPDPEPAPLYTAELTQTGPVLPDLPSPPPPSAQPTPPPQSEVAEPARKLTRVSRRTRSRRGGVSEVAERETHEKDSHESAQQEQAAPAQPNSPPAVVETAKVTAATPAGDTSQATPIGQLTAGPTPDADESRRQASDLIQSTQHGVDSLHRSLSADQTKTVAQIRNFLSKAEQAIHNGDVDGAYTLATKAKLLLDELTGAS